MVKRQASVTVCRRSSRTKKPVQKKNSAKAAEDKSMKKVIKKQKTNSPGKTMNIVTPPKKTR